jgi:hypothetical protein
MHLLGDDSMVSSQFLKEFSENALTFRENDHSGKMTIYRSSAGKKHIEFRERSHHDVTKHFTALNQIECI